MRCPRQRGDSDSGLNYRSKRQGDRMIVAVGARAIAKRKADTYAGSLAAALALVALNAAPAHAVEGGLGRPVSGATIVPFAGVVPPESANVFSPGEIYYDASIGGSRTVPINLNLAVGVDVKASFTPFTFAHIWDTGTKRWNYASAVSLSLAWL